MKAVCLGIIIADIIGRPIRELPEKGKLVLTDTITLHNGGCATNTSIALAKLGISVTVAGAIGRDVFGDDLISRLEGVGVDAAGVIRKEDAGTSKTIVLVDKEGERSFIHEIGANGSYTFDDFDLRLFDGADILHLAGTFLMPSLDSYQTKRLLLEAKERGIKTSFDTVWNPSGNWMKVLEPSLQYIDFFLPSYAEGRELSGSDDPKEICDFFLDRGVGVVGLKMGREGSIIATRNSRHTVKPYRVRSIDTTGAGDAWVAGFLTGIMHGWDLERSGLFANAVGACSVTSVGASTGIRGFAETLLFMNENG
jgi:sugar/nucleoside kinase (ribokinase family)